MFTDQTLWGFLANADSQLARVSSFARADERIRKVFESVNDLYDVFYFAFRDPGRQVSEELSIPLQRVGVTQGDLEPVSEMLG